MKNTLEILAVLDIHIAAGVSEISTIKSSDSPYWKSGEKEAEIAKIERRLVKRRKRKLDILNQLILDIYKEKEALCELIPDEE